MKLKPNPPKLPANPLRLSKYLSAIVPPPPGKVYWEYKIPAGEWQMLGNDTVGDCEIARIAHMVMLATAHTGLMFTPTLAQVMAVYSAISGYDPTQEQPDGSNPTDTGCDTPDVLNYWQNNGIGGHKITSWVEIDATNIDDIKQAIYLFGGVCVDIAVYRSMMDQFSARQPWDNPSGPLEGYHAIPLFGYGRAGTTCVTWGALQSMGWDMLKKIIQGAYAAITPDWINQATLKTVSGFDLAALQADAKVLQVNS